VPHTLLLADDSVTIQRVIELTFADEDVTVVAVSDGDQAIERLEASPPDIVLADIGMPGKNGYEVAQYIRRSPALAHIPVVLLTGAFEPVDQARADDAGCDGVLAKPFEPQLVISRVKELLARPRRTPDAAGPAAAPGGAAGEESSVLAAAPLVAAPAEMSWAPSAPEAPAATFSPAASQAEALASPVSEGGLNDYFDRLDAAFSKLPQTAPAPSAQPVDDLPDPPAPATANDHDWYANVTESGRNEPWDVPAPPGDVALGDLSLTYASPQPETPFAAPRPQESFAAVASVEPVTEAPPALEAAPLPGPDERLAPIEESAPVEPEALLPAAAEPPASAAAFATPGPAPAVPAAPTLELPLPNAPRLPALADAFAALLAAEQGEALPAGALWPVAPPPAPAPAVVDEEIIDMITRRVLDRLSDAVVRDAVSDIALTIAERLIREEIERIKASIK
jgi:CheY-like chemotaxis protein